MKLCLKSAPPETFATPCIVVGVTEDGPFAPATAAIDQASGGAITRMMASKDISAATGKTTLLHALKGIAAERVLVVGFGKLKKLTGSSFDRACLLQAKFCAITLSSPAMFVFTKSSLKVAIFPGG